MRLKIDLHVHTVYSDGSGTVEQVLDTARRRGLDGLAITDHNTVRAYYKAKTYHTRLLVLPGFEVHTDAGDVLVLGLEELLPRFDGWRFEDLIRSARNRRGLTILCHPGIERGMIHRWLRCKPDAVEVLNASYPLMINVKRGWNVALKLGVPTVGGSDAHDPQVIGDAYTEVDVEKPCCKSVIESIKAGKVTWGGGLSPISARFRIGLNYVSTKTLGTIRSRLRN